jgi:hypothetical protein
LTGATPGPPSSLFAFTIGTSPGGGGCTAAPASPVVTGAIAAGTATVSWPAVPGATSYIISAGSTPGASNVAPPTNVGPSTTVSASGLPPGFSAWVRVIAVNACGQSPPRDFFLSSESTLRVIPLTFVSPTAKRGFAHGKPSGSQSRPPFQ